MRSEKISNEIASLKNILLDSGMQMKSSKFNVLAGISEYVLQLQARLQVNKFYEPVVAVDNTSCMSTNNYNTSDENETVYTEANTFHYCKENFKTCIYTIPDIDRYLHDYYFIYII